MYMYSANNNGRKKHCTNNFIYTHYPIIKCVGVSVTRNILYYIVYNHIITIKTIQNIWSWVRPRLMSEAPVSTQHSYPESWLTQLSPKSNAYAQMWYKHNLVFTFYKQNCPQHVSLAVMFWNKVHTCNTLKVVSIIYHLFVYNLHDILWFCPRRRRHYHITPGLCCIKQIDILFS